MVLHQGYEINDEAIQRYIPVVKKFGLITPSGLGNLGDASIQQAVVQNIRKYHPEAEIYGFTLNPLDTENKIGIPSFPLCTSSNWIGEQWWLGSGNNRFIITLTKTAVRLRSVSNPIVRKIGLALVVPWLEILAWVRSYKTIQGFDFLLVSGGGQLDDYWGGPWAHPFTLFMWSILAKLCRINFAIVSVGAGPIDHPLSKWFLKRVLSIASYRSYRDKDSESYINRVVDFDKNDPIYPDLAHSLQVTQYQNLQVPVKHRPLIGIGPMPYLHPDLWPEHNSSAYWSYLDKLGEFIDWLLQNQYGILFFTGEVDTDRLVIRDLRKLLDRNGAVYSEGQIIEEPIETVDDLMSELAKTDLVISARFHGTILPQLLNKPVLAISHHRKVEMLMVDSGLGDYSLPIDTFDVETMKERFIALEANQEHIKQQLAQRTEDYKLALDKQYERLFKNL